MLFKGGTEMNKVKKEVTIKAITCAILFGLTMMLAGCSKTEKTIAGVAGGAVTGAVIGGIAGGGTGAVIGGGAGALAGGLIGSQS